MFKLDLFPSKCSCLHCIDFITLIEIILCRCPVTIRLKSIKNIQKITKSMKMVAAAKYARAERQLKPARVYGTGALGMCLRVGSLGANGILTL